MKTDASTAVPLDSKTWKYSGFAAEKALLAFDGKNDTMWSIGRTLSHYVVDMQQVNTISCFSTAALDGVGSSVAEMKIYGQSPAK